MKLICSRCKLQRTAVSLALSALLFGFATAQESEPSATPNPEPEAKQSEKDASKNKSEPIKSKTDQPQANGKGGQPQEPIKPEPKPEPRKMGHLGYGNTPMIRGQRWKVHDINRPRPRAVVPGEASSYEKPGSPPSDAIVLLSDSDLSNWGQVIADDPAAIYYPQWKVEGGVLEVVPGSGDLRTLDTFADCQLHLEWASPEEVIGASQQRGDSGVLLMGKYEIQILDSYRNRTFADGQAGAIYGQHPPLVNASRANGQWQVYDIVFESPEFQDGQLKRPAFVTVMHNGVLLHHRRELLGFANETELPAYIEHQPAGPIVLQDHGSPVRYRNIWIRPLN